LELFKKHGLDPEKVRLYRDVLNDVPPTPLEELHRKRLLLASLLDKLNKLHAEAMQPCDDLESLRVHCYCWEGLSHSVGAFNRDGDQSFDRWHTGPFQWWDLLNDKWAAGFCPGFPVISEHSERPKNTGALRAWNLFVVAFRRPPERLFYGNGDGYYAAFRDTKGEAVFVRECCVCQGRCCGDRKCVAPVAVNAAH
jgi:hypothetical protein